MHQVENRIGHCFVIAVATAMLVTAGCRTYGRPFRWFAPQLEKECVAVTDLTPDATRYLQHRHAERVRNWTTGGNAIPAACAPSLQTVAPRDVQSVSFVDAIADDGLMMSDGEGLESVPLEELSETQSLAEHRRPGQGQLVRPSFDRTVTVGDNEAWVFSLADVVGFALTQNRVIRRDADFISTRSRILEFPEQVVTSLQPSIQDSGYLFGQRGEAAALSDFDAQLNFRTTWGRNEAIQNNLFLSGGIAPGGALTEDTAESVIELAQDTRSGGRARLFHTISYDGSNRQDLLIPSAYRLSIGAEFRQPLLAGAGRLYTDVAGPPGDLIRGVTGVGQGVLIARNQSRVARLELKREVANLITDIESVYWELRSAHEAVHLAKSAVESLEQYRDIVEARIDADPHASELDRLRMMELQLTAEQLNQQQSDRLRQANARINRLLDLPVDSQVRIMPENAMFQADLIADADELSASAIIRRAEIQQQRHRIRIIDLQIRAAQSLLLPQLDGIARYQVNGFGDSLSREVIPGPDQDIQSAYDNLSQGDFTGWELGFQFSHRFGRRLERTRLRNLRLQAQKERVLLEEQEKEIRREVAALVDQLQASADQQSLLRSQLEIVSKRRSVILQRYHANDRQASILAVAEADFSPIPIRISMLENRSAYCGLVSRLHSAVGTTLFENGIAFDESMEESPPPAGAVSLEKPVTF